MNDLLCCMLAHTVTAWTHSTLDIRQETRLSLTNRATRFCKCNGVTDPHKSYPPGHPDLRRSRSNRVRHIWGDTQNVFCALGLGVCLTVTNVLLPRVGERGRFYRSHVKQYNHT